MITYKEFEVIRTLLKAEGKPQNIAEYVFTNKHYYVFKSVEEVEELTASLEKKGYLKDGVVTQMAMEEIEPLKVENAVILAAGGSDISAKSSPPINTQGSVSRASDPSSLQIILFILSAISG